MSDGASFNVNKYVQKKLELLQNTKRDLKNIYSLMTSEPEKIFSESNDGYSVVSITYGQFIERTGKIAGSLNVVLKNVKKGSIVGLYMNNCQEWLECFWGILMLGYRPLLMNIRMSKSILEDIIKQYDVKAVISDSAQFSADTFMLSDIVKLAQESKCESYSAENDTWADELIFMSSGTTNNVKLCAYNGETMYYQICDSVRLIQSNKLLKRHYRNALKQLVFLPLYHVFGLIAVYFWFSFFGCTMVFLKDYSPDTILNTVKLHKVTHIFSIPLLWNTIYKTAIRTARETKQYDKLMKGIELSDKLAGIPVIGRLFAKKAFSSVREKIFGDSIQFLICGGSAVSPDVLRFFNAIGYHLAEGYGMTEAGITSLELSADRKLLNSRSVGSPFASIRYMLSEDGELLVSGRTMADRIMEGGKVVSKAEDGWFHTNDFASQEGKAFFILGRKDDVIIGSSGENLNPDILEDKLKIEGAENVCIVKKHTENENNQVLLVVQTRAYCSSQALKDVLCNAQKRVSELLLDSVISQIIITRDALMEPDDFKFNRRRIAQRIESGEIKAVDPENDEIKVTELISKICEVISQSTGIETDRIKPGSNLFYDLGLSSLDYFTIVLGINKEFSVELPMDGDSTFKTAAEIADYIEKHR